MSVQVYVLGANHDSDEYKAALKLRNIINDGLCQLSVIGEVVIYANATLFGQDVKDIDLLMIGILQNYTPELYFINRENEYIKAKVNIHSFCTTIEIKSHDISGIFRNGTDIYVMYGEKAHCVTEQSNKQKISAKNFFERTLSMSPYITNLIWFTSTNSQEINSLLTVESNIMQSNVFARDVVLADIIQLLVWQRCPKFYNGSFNFDSNIISDTVRGMQRELDFFTKAKKCMGELTRKKIEQICFGNLTDKCILNENNTISILRGRAGTGKTVGLIQTALKLVDEKETRVLMLTFNRALVSDIRRLFALAELPDMFNHSCIMVCTMHSYFYKLINHCLYNDGLDGEDFIRNYSHYLIEMLQFLENEDVNGEYIQLIKSENMALDWEYVLIDEAQDWINNERDLIFKLFKKGHILVADGGQQFVRDVEGCDWSVVNNRNNIKLKYCLRQKSNIIKFLNKFTEKYGANVSKIADKEILLGGRVIIVSNDYLGSGIHSSELARLKALGNSCYDMLYLVPSDMVRKEHGEVNFALTDEFHRKGISFWNGLDNKTRLEYPTNLDDVRLLQYESARGLEGWTVVCLDFDVFLDIKDKQYNPQDMKDALLLESEEEKKLRYMYHWAMIPLTRAIDTLVITLRNKESHIGKLLKAISEEINDYVIWL